MPFSSPRITLRNWRRGSKDSWRIGVSPSGSLERRGKTLPFSPGSGARRGSWLFLPIRKKRGRGGEMFKKYLQGFLARHRRNRVLTRLDRYFVDLHRGYENVNYDFHENGERFVLQTLKKQLRIQTVFDVGANRGGWSRIASGIFPEAQIYAFEILPETYKRLVENCRDYKMINPCSDRFSGRGRRNRSLLFLKPGRQDDGGGEVL